MDAAKEERKVEAAPQAAAKGTGAEIPAGVGAGGQQVKRERAKTGAAPNGTSPSPAVAPEVKVPITDEGAHEVAQAVAEVSRASLGAMQAAAEATVEMVQHAFAMAEERTTRAIEGAGSLKAEAAAPEAEQAGQRVAKGPTPRRTAMGGSTYFDVFVEGAEASLRAALDVQTAALSAGLSMLEAANSVNRELARHWAAMAREAQEAALAAWRGSLRSAGSAPEQDR